MTGSTLRQVAEDTLQPHGLGLIGVGRNRAAHGSDGHGDGGTVRFDPGDRPAGDQRPRHGAVGRRRHRAHPERHRLAERRRRAHRLRGRHHLRDRRADQSFGAQCHDRGGARRRSRQGLCRGRRRGQDARQSDLARHRRHLAAGCRHPGSDQALGGGNLRDRAHHRQIDHGLDQHRVGGAAAEHDNARHRRKHSQRRRPHGARVRRDQLGR